MTLTRKGNWVQHPLGTPIQLPLAIMVLTDVDQYRTKANCLFRSKTFSPHSQATS